MRIWQLGSRRPSLRRRGRRVCSRSTATRGAAPAGRRGDAQPAADVAMPVPVTQSSRRRSRSISTIRRGPKSIRNVTLQAKVSGYLKEQPAPDGADVKEGDLLYRLDPRDFQAALDQAKAQAERDAASLDYLRSNFKRGTELAKSG